VNAAADNPSTLPHGTQRCGYKVSNRGKYDCRIERDRRQKIRGTGPSGTERAGEALRLDIAWTCKGVDLPGLPNADLGDDVGRRAKLFPNGVNAPLGKLLSAAGGQP